MVRQQPRGFIKLALASVSLGLIVGCSQRSSPTDLPVDEDRTTEASSSGATKELNPVANGSWVKQAIPIRIVFNQDTDEFLIETRMYSGTAIPIFPGVLSIETVIDGERYKGLIPPDMGDDAESSMNYWTPISGVHFRDQQWIINRNGIWTRSSMKRGSPEYEAGDPVKVWVRKLYRDNESVPFYMFTVESTAIRID